MNKNFKKSIALTLVAASVLSFAGCKKENGASPDKEVTLKWILSGSGKQLDSDEVWNLFNEKLKEKLPNTKVEFENISTSDYAEKWKLIAASREEVDMAWQGWMIDYEQEVKNGSYLALDELMEKYAPNLRKSMPEWVWEPQKIDGEIYAIPNYQMMVSRPTALRTYKELSDKYLDVEAAEKVFFDYKKGPLSPLTDEWFDVLENYLQKLKENGELGLGLSPKFGDWFGEINNGTEIETGYLENVNGRLVVKDAFSEDVPDTYYRRMADLFKKGYIRKDALTIQDYDKDVGVEGGYSVWIHQADDFTASQESLKYGKEIQLIRLHSKFMMPSGASATNSTIPSTSKNPERAMQLYEIIHSSEDTELYNLLVYGIENKHYKKTGDNTIETLDYNGAPTSDSNYGVQKWIVGNTFNAFDTQSDVPGYNDYVENVMHKNAEENILAGFKLDTDPIKAELAQIKSVKGEFKGLKIGAYENYAEMLKDYRNKIQTSGQQKVLAEIQKQLDEQINNK